MTILLVAEESAGHHTLKQLKQSRHHLAGVLTGSERTAGKNPVALAADRMEVPVIPANRVTDPAFADWMRTRKIEVLLNVHSLYLIHPEVIEAADFGAFNLHPGPLPGYAGLNAPSWAIYNGEDHHAVTLHRLTEAIDTGDIVYTDVFPISESDTGLTVSINCVKRGIPLIGKLLDDLEQNPESLPRQRQDLSQRSYFSRNRIPNDGFIEWDDSAARIDAFIRACNYSPFPSPWGLPKTVLNERVLFILETKLSGLPCDATPGIIGSPINGKTAIASGDNWILVSHCMEKGETVPASSVLIPGSRLAGCPVESRSGTG